MGIVSQVSASSLGKISFSAPICILNIKTYPKLSIDYRKIKFMGPEYV